MRHGLSCSEAGKLGSIAVATTIARQKQERIAEYYQSPIQCKYCSFPIAYEKRHTNIFCNHVCSASYNSPNIIHNPNNVYNKNCFFCNKKIENGAKFCTRTCQKNYNWNNIKFDLLKSGLDVSYKHHNAKRYLIELNCGKCQICGLDEWQGKSMPLVLDHINGHSEDGSLSNLRVICNNCDALTETFKSKNKGNGRAKRRQRYKEGKSY